jgi:hypothetical protein
MDEFTARNVVLTNEPYVLINTKEITTLLVYIKLVDCPLGTRGNPTYAQTSISVFGVFGRVLGVRTYSTLIHNLKGREPVG